MIVRAFQYSTFSKIPEFIKFRDRLRNSLQRAISLRQILRVEVLRKWNVDRAHLNTYFQTLEADWLESSAGDLDGMVLLGSSSF